MVFNVFSHRGESWKDFFHCEFFFPLDIRFSPLLPPREWKEVRELPPAKMKPIPYFQLHLYILPGCGHAVQVLAGRLHLAAVAAIDEEPAGRGQAAGE